jgi:ABC-type nitrate/sulfonate/bicarbonate transport system substrate-binding protein
MLKGGAAAAAISVVPNILKSGTALAQAQKMSLSMARLPFGTAASILPRIMTDNGLFQKAAATHGYDLDVEWADFPSGGPIAQGLVAEQVRFGPIGVTPLLNLLVNNQPVSPIAVAEGRLKFVIAVRDGSPIRNMEDLRGKTIALVVGTDYQFSLASMLVAGLGTANYDELGIKLVNVSTPAQLAAVPQGADAAIAHAHPFLKAKAELGSKAIANSYGYTEDYYSGPLGEGAGHLLKGAESSPFWPESIYGHRAFWVVRNEIVEEHPKLVTAFLVALHEALDHLNEIGPEKAAELVAKDWGIPPGEGKTLVEDDLVPGRGWLYVTEGDVEMMWRQTQLVIENGVIKPREPFTWEKLVATFSAAADPVRAAWEARGSRPSQQEIADTTKDLRGLPVWESANWTAP